MQVHLPVYALAAGGSDGLMRCVHPEQELVACSLTSFVLRERRIWDLRYLKHSMPQRFACSDRRSSGMDGRAFSSVAFRAAWLLMWRVCVFCQRLRWELALLPSSVLPSLPCCLGWASLLYRPLVQVLLARVAVPWPPQLLPCRPALPLREVPQPQG